jgi:allophanate hydrolase
MASIAVPAGIADNGIPFGITLVGPTFSDRALLSIARRLHARLGPGYWGAGCAALEAEISTTVNLASIDVLVCGAHLDGLPLNWQLKERGATLVASVKTAPVYRMYALAGGPPYRPGLVLDEALGAAIEAEIWRVPADQFGSFVAGIPAPLGIGKVRLEDGSQVSGFICEPYGIEGAEEITRLGGWRAYSAAGPG